MSITVNDASSYNYSLDSVVHIVDAQRTVNYLGNDVARQVKCKVLQALQGRRALPGATIATDGGAEGGNGGRERGGVGGGWGGIMALIGRNQCASPGGSRGNDNPRAASRALLPPPAPTSHLT